MGDKENTEFTVHTLNDEGKAKARHIQTTFDRCLNELAGTCPTGREFALTKTHMETACFFAKKAMANQAANQDMTT